MYHTREASERLDKVYALLGMSSDNPSTRGLSPDYSIKWNKLFHRLVQSLWDEKSVDRVSVETWDDEEIAVIRAKGCVVGEVSGVQRDTWGDRQNVDITSKDELCLSVDRRWSARWTLQASAKSIQKGDVVCLLEGASRPTIIRLREDHFAVIAIAVTPTSASIDIRDTGNIQAERERFEWYDLLRSITPCPHEYLLVWDWGRDPERLPDEVPRYPKTELDEHPARSRNVALISESAGKYEEAEKILRKELEFHERAPGKELLHTLAAMDNLALNYRKNNQLEKAEVLYLDVVQRRRAVQGTDHPDTLSTMEHLAMTYRRQGHWVREVRKLEAVMDLVEQRGKYAQVSVARKDIGWIAGLLDKEAVELLLGRLDQTVNRVSIAQKAIIRTAGLVDKDAVKLLLDLLDQTGTEAPITEDVVKAAAGNETNGIEVMKLLMDRLDRTGNKVPITEDAIQAATGNRNDGEVMIKLLFDRLDQTGKELPITEDAIKAAAGNLRGIMKLLLDRLDRTGNEVPITEDVIKAAAGYRQGTVTLLLDRLDRTGNEVPITEDVIKAAAGNRWLGVGGAVMKLLLDRLGRIGNEVPITENVIKAAAGNETNGVEVMKLLLDRLDQTGNAVPITEDVVKAAAGNTRNGKAVMKLLLDRLDRTGIEKWYRVFADFEEEGPTGTG
ncbi:hypothetical protein DL765_004368 [Monosporascus sp. GIB2]|nr:hypothetical protein DL765_004368 [Monosporascus sp. GIB2]